jgi:hypothetical protein
MTLEELRLTILLDDSYIPKTVEEYQLLPQLTEDELLTIKCVLYISKPTYSMWLYPISWYDYMRSPFIFDKNHTSKERINKYSPSELPFGLLKPINYDEVFKTT